MIQKDIIIIGAGPAGCTAAIYASRSGFDCALIGGSVPGGQLLYTNSIENFPGATGAPSGFELIDRIHKQTAQLGIEIIRDNADRLELDKPPYVATLAGGQQYCAPIVIVATGANARWLGLASEEKFRGHGVSSCATCDGFFQKGRDVCVIGGGNTALEDAIFLTKFVNKVYLVHRRYEFRADEILVAAAKANPKIELALDSVPVEFTGADALDGLKVKNIKTGAERTLACSGAFVAIGTIPNINLVKGQLELDTENYIRADAHCRTSKDGVFAAGDVMDPYYRQAVIAAASGARAAIAAGHYLQNLASRCPAKQP
ncbi:MAG: FAD-dependent oxidoreductase [Elusimicrobiaceae bacterium]|nr:FAD-dependent oxidoreductase [Elusimicrobiaceae bacterium]